ncbi:MAG: enoyl-CoA hydratase/isomerase family protein [Burkholderiales bacterium]
MTTQTSSRYSTITVDAQPATARITLANPPLNIIDLPLMDELLAALEEIEQRGDIGTIVFAGSARAFSAGVDIKIHTPDKVQAMLAKFHSIIRAVLATKKITIAAVEGACLGGGAELAMVCDLVYTARDATWGFPEITLGCYPPVAAVALPALVGQKRAAEMVFTGRQISGDEALAIGLATGAARAEELGSLVNDAVARLEKLSPAALVMTKKAFYAWDSIHLDKGLARSEKIYLEELMQTADAQEGVQAYIEKRKPVWKGK